MTFAKCIATFTIASSFALMPAAARSAPDTAPPRITPFSTTPSGLVLPAGWVHQLLPGVDKPNRFDFVSEPGESKHNVLRIQSEQSASTLAFAIHADIAETPRLSWRWKVSRAVDGSDVREKSGDDYAARVYVLFDLPLDRLSLGDRMKISAARMLQGVDIPAAALCYVWGKQQASGESGWNPYTDRVRMIVVDSGNEKAGQWQDVSRDIAADFKAAFGEPVAPIAGIVLSADTDNTGEAVETRFGDLKFEAKP